MRPSMRWTTVGRGLLASAVLVTAGVHLIGKAVAGQLLASPGARPPALQERGGETARVFACSPEKGTLMAVGTETPVGENDPTRDQELIRFAGATRQFRRLHVGDRVAAGQLLGLVRSANPLRSETALRHQVEVARTEWAAAKQLRMAAYEHYRSKQLFFGGRIPNVIVLEPTFRVTPIDISRGLFSP